jgi:hypothetical protein
MSGRSLCLIIRRSFLRRHDDSRGRHCLTTFEVMLGNDEERRDYLCDGGE